MSSTAPRCIALLGGSFDPVHNGHVALASLFAKLLVPDELRILPAGNPWQKDGMQASPADRIEMARRAFAGQAVPVVIDEQEIFCSTPTYTIETLRALRRELGPQPAIVFLLGADQLLRLDTWREWQSLFDYASIAAASRPGFSIDTLQLPPAVAREFARRAATPSQLRSTAHGLTYLASNLAVDVAATEIRDLLQNGAPDSALAPLIPASVLDYIQQHNLYKS
ncbi:MAG: nicotinate-nucleotide adenylyltransferase [Janthinobacterium lividum]